MHLSARQNPRTHTHTTHTQQKAQRPREERDMTRELSSVFSFLYHLCHWSAIFSPSRPSPLQATAHPPHQIVTSATTTVRFSSCTRIVRKRRTQPLQRREAACVTLNSILWLCESFFPLLLSASLPARCAKTVTVWRDFLCSLCEKSVASRRRVSRACAALLSSWWSLRPPRYWLHRLVREVPAEPGIHVCVCAYVSRLSRGRARVSLSPLLHACSCGKRTSCFSIGHF